MYKLVIVEDEDNIRRSLECFIPWEKMGFQVVGTFSDGSDALAYLQEHPCDAVLTDILMSKMSGLEMIRHLQTIQPQLKVVILSGHGDFAYAQQAITYKVTHYLVKPVDEEELMLVFKGIKEQLDEHAAGQDTAASETRDLKLMLQKSFFRDLLSGRVASEKELEVYLKLLDLKLQKDCRLLAFDLMAMRQEVAEEEPDTSAEESLAQFANAQTDCSCFFFEERDGRWRVIFTALPESETDFLQKDCSRSMQELVALLNSTQPCEFAFRLTHSVMGIRELLSGVETPETAESVDQLQQVDEQLCESVMSDYKLLILELDLGSKDTLIHILNSIVFDLRNSTPADVQFILKNLYSVIELNYKKRKINVWDITDGKFNFNHLYRSQDLDTIGDYLKEDFCALSNALKVRRPVTDHNVVSRLVQYLNEHLDEDIAHDVLAAKYRMHPGYLSRLFKQEMGETLSEYLLRVKIEKAAKLLKSGQYKVGDIASKVGYSASSYFSIMFKKYTGYSPREYTQRISL